MSIHRQRFEHLRLGPLRGLKRCDLLNLGRINVLCGKNNTGKSTLLEAASNDKTVCFGLTPDDEFVESLITANNRALDEQLFRSPVPYGIPRNALPAVVREAAKSRPAWFANEEKELVELINKMVGVSETPNLRYAVHSGGMVEDLELSFKYHSCNGLYVPPTRKIEVSGKIATGEEPRPEGGSVINRLFHLHNQAAVKDWDSCDPLKILLKKLPMDLVLAFSVTARTNMLSSSLRIRRLGFLPNTAVRASRI